LKIKNLRWIIVALLFIATGLSFLDRQVLSLAIIKIKHEFLMSDVEYGWINTAFLLSYAIMFTLGGWLIDKFGTRLGLVGDFRDTALKSFYLASYEARGFVWTSTLALKFKQVNGYDISKFIPSLFDPELFSAETTKKVQTDFKKTL